MLVTKPTAILLGSALFLSSLASAEDVTTFGSPSSSAGAPAPLSGEDRALLASEGLKLELFSSDGIEKNLPPSTGANGIPETVQGIWWVTVNPLGFLLADLGAATSWDSETRTAVQQIYAPGSFTFHNDSSGTGVFLTFLKIHAQFVYRFSKDYKYAALSQAFEILGQRFEVPPSIVRYQMRWVEDGHFVRESWFFGQRAPDYQLRRIVKADGTRDADYSAYLLNADDKSYVAVRD